MKKTILISVGVLIILIIVGVWAYLFMFGAPKNSGEIFANFGKGEDSNIREQVPENITVDTSDLREDGSTQALKQLTTKPVGGAVFVEDDILYVEQGTGHIYSINLESGKETLMNGTTIPGATEALFSEGGTYVAITTFTQGEQRTIIKKSREDEWKGVALPPESEEIAFMSATGTLNYFVQHENGGTAYSYNLIKELNTELFTIPLRDVHIVWGKEIYAYTTPTAFQTGYLYRVLNGRLAYVGEGGPSLMGIKQNEGVVITKIQNGSLESAHVQGNRTIKQPIPLIPEKCTVRGESTFCAFPTDDIFTNSFPDDWYKGIISYSDILWKINTQNSEAIVLSDFLDESGREIDVHKIGTDSQGERIYFVNKNDNTLWMFDTTI